MATAKTTRDLREDEVTFEVLCELDHISIKGNVLASGDDEEDQAAEDWVAQQIESGNAWAWGIVTVRASWEGFTGRDTLGGCSYRSREEFMGLDGYYPDMRTAALADLNRNIRMADASLRQLRCADED